MHHKGLGISLDLEDDPYALHAGLVANVGDACRSPARSARGARHARRGAALTARASRESRESRGAAWRAPVSFFSLTMAAIFSSRLLFATPYGSCVTTTENDTGSEAPPTGMDGGHPTAICCDQHNG